MCDTVSLNIDDLKVITPLGRGAKGVVFLVQTPNGDLLALKSILRSSMDKKKKKISTENESDFGRISFEQEVLANFDHPLLPKLHGVLQTDKIVGYAIDYCPGSNLNTLRKKQTEKMFSDDIIRFYAAELVLALEYLHSLGIVYRDLKPENVMVQASGHLMLIDFDLSTKLAPRSPENRSPESRSPENRSSVSSEPKRQQQIAQKKASRFACLFKRPESAFSIEESVDTSSSDSTSSSESCSVEKSNSFVGTEEYLAPEVILGDGHDFAVDWWCLGVMLYEMLYGATPFRGLNRKETFYRVISKKPDLTGESTALRDLIGKLLEKDPKKRISVKEIKGHAYFKAVNWETITDMPRPPYIPPVTDVEGKAGNRNIELESYVQEVFKIEEESKRSSNCEEMKIKDGWVNNNHPTQITNDNFLVF